MHTIERQLQQNLNNVQELATRNGFRFSKAKTVWMHERFYTRNDQELIQSDPKPCREIAI